MIAVNWHPDSRQLRWFAVATLVALGLLGGAVLWLGGPRELAMGLWSTGLGCFVIGLAVPAAIRPLYLGLTAVSLPIGWVVSHLVLRIMYYGVFTPVGIAFRLTGRDPLRLKRQSGATTYWVRRGEQRGAASYFRQS